MNFYINVFKNKIMLWYILVICNTVSYLFSVKFPPCEVVWHNIDILLYYFVMKMHKPLPPADFPPVVSLWCLHSLPCVVFIFMPPFCHISSSSPNALLISVHFYPSHCDLYQIYSLMAWVVKWSGDTGEFYWYKWQLSPSALQGGKWNTVHSPSTLICFLCLILYLSSVYYFYIIPGIIDSII